jgi:cytochrome c553
MNTALTVVWLLFIGHPVLAATGEDIYVKGLNACVACHGERAEGQPDAAIPRLAGMPADYMKQQIGHFAKGERVNDMMTPVAKALPPEAAADVSNYIAGLSSPKATSTADVDPAAISAGEKLALQGDWARGVPPCSQCHGSAGLGVGHAFPPLAGQGAPYIENQLKAWQGGQRSNDLLALMTGIAGRLSDADVRAVAVYYASLEPAGSRPAGTAPPQASETAPAGGAKTP